MAKVNYPLQRVTIGRVYGGQPLLFITVGQLNNPILLDNYPQDIKPAVFRINFLKAEHREMFLKAEKMAKAGIGTIQLRFSKYQEEIETVGVDFFDRLRKDDDDSLLETFYSAPEVVVYDISDLNNILVVTGQLVQTQSTRIMTRKDIPNVDSIVAFNWIGGSQDSLYVCDFIVNTSDGRKLKEVALLDIKNRTV